MTRRTLSRLLKKNKRPPTEAGSPAAEKALAELADESADSDWAAHFNAELLSVALDRIRTHFEQPTWRAFERVWLERQSAIATSETMGLPIEKVYLAKSRILKRLQEELLMLAEDVPQFVPLG